MHSRESNYLLQVVILSFTYLLQFSRKMVTNLKLMFENIHFSYRSTSLAIGLAAKRTDLFYILTKDNESCKLHPYKSNGNIKNSTINYTSN